MAVVVKGWGLAVQALSSFDELAPNLCFGPARATPEQRTQWPSINRPPGGAAGLKGRHLDLHRGDEVNP